MSIHTLEKATAPATNAAKPTQHVVANGAIPPLQSGDHLSRAEFERRYDAHPEIKKAELIEGVVYVASPVRVRRHGIPHSDSIGWLGVYQAFTPGVNIANNATRCCQDWRLRQPYFGKAIWPVCWPCCTRRWRHRLIQTL
ncbi:MAG: hypothetical protein U0350_03510 [Caldilineaceae bacterium]